jgi:phenylalanyl-tRNA synthetase beta chain
MLGYDRVPSTLPGSRGNAGKLAQPLDPVERIREICLGAGFDETVNWSFASEKKLDIIPGIGKGHAKVTLMNPLNENWTVMRTSQLSGLMEAAAYNLNHEIASPRLFEIGPCFWADGASSAQGSDKVGKDWTPLPGEPKTLSLLAICDSADLAAVEIRRLTDVLTSVARELTGSRVTTAPAAHEELHQGRSADVILGRTTIGAVGEVKRQVSSQLEVEGRAVVAEIDLTNILRGTHAVTYRLPGRFPAVTEDIAVVVPAKSLARNALAVIREAAGQLLQEVDLYDEYRDERMDAAHKSWTFRLVFRSDERTLVAEEVATARAQVVAALQKAGAKLRT